MGRQWAAWRLVSRVAVGWLAFGLSLVAALCAQTLKYLTQYTAPNSAQTYNPKP